MLNDYELIRKNLGVLIIDIHERKPSYGYHRINAGIRCDTGLVVSDNLVHKICKLLNIKSKAKHIMTWKRIY
ncbi:MAG: transposase [Bacilli bacterium]|nr:transposase [Bacilli bacterium]